MKVLYFSATGNSLAVAKKIGGELVSIPQVLKQGVCTFEDDAIGFVFPDFDGTFPRIMTSLMDAVSCKAGYFFAVVTYGFFPGTALSDFARLAARHGVRLDYGAELKMVDNYVPLFDVNKEIAKIPEKRIDENLKRITGEIHAREHRPIKSSFVQKAGVCFEKPLLKKTNSGKVARDFTVNAGCVKCGTCVRVCPAGNISLENGVVFGDRCYSCFACLHACPKNAIHVKGERSGKRWRNPAVTLKELIDANRQATI